MSMKILSLFTGLFLLVGCTTDGYVSTGIIVYDPYPHPYYYFPPVVVVAPYYHPYPPYHRFPVVPPRYVGPHRPDGFIQPTPPRPPVVTPRPTPPTPPRQTLPPLRRPNAPAHK